jgi:hypothetical protein
MRLLCIKYQGALGISADLLRSGVIGDASEPIDRHWRSSATSLLMLDVSLRKWGF